MSFISLLLAWFVIALAVVQGSNAQCDIVCCNKVQNAHLVPNVPSVTGMSNADAANLGLVGSTCTSLTVISHGMSCATKQLPVCCTDNHYNGTVSLGCAYVNAMSP